MDGFVLYFLSICLNKNRFCKPATALDGQVEMCYDRRKDRKGRSIKPDYQSERGILMKIAVCFENGQIFQHFGHTKTFKIYQIEDNSIQSTLLLDAPESGHGALAGFLQQNGVDTLICGGIGAGARTALANASIQLYPGVTGDADQAVEDLLKSRLVYDPDAQCADHAHHHHDSSHSCSGGNCGHHCEK